MEKMQSLEEFYQSKFDRVPENIRNGVGHFNVFTIDEYIGKNAKPLVYSRKDYFKITLIVGRNRIHYADKVIDIQKQAIFSPIRRSLTNLNGSMVRRQDSSVCLHLLFFIISET